MKKFTRLILAIAIASCAQPVLLTAQLSSTDTRAAREALYVARGSVSAADLARINAALLADGGLSLKGDTAAARVVTAVRAVTGDAYKGQLNSLLALIGVAAPVSPPVAPPITPTSPPVVTPPPSTTGGLTEADVRRIVAEEIAKRPVVTSASLPNRVDGDLVVTGRLCIVTLAFATGCRDDAQEVVQIRQAKAASIGLEANMDGSWRQDGMAAGAIGKAGWATVGMSPDLGLRLCQNQRWTNTGGYVGFIVPPYPVSCTGNDSQATWSWNWLKPGRVDHRTQQLVLDEDEAAGVIFFTTWRSDRRIGVRTSSFKYAFDQPFIFPTKPGQ